MRRSIGVDLHKNSFRVCYYRNEKDYQFETYKIRRTGLEVFKKSLRKSDEVAVESTGNTGYFVRDIEAKVKRVRVINPRQFKVITMSVKKTDDEDALKIARYLKKDLIPEVRMANKEQQKMRSLVGTRDKLVKLRTGLKNKIHNILNANGIVSRKEMFSGTKGLEFVKRLGLEDSYQFEIELIVEQIKHLNESIKRIDEQIKQRSEKLEGHKSLKSIKGISDTGAAIFLSAIGDVNDFRDEKSLFSYFGIVPRVRVSNETRHYGKITKRGNKIARTALVQSTLVAMRYSPYLREFYDRIKNKRGSAKAIIATSKKMLGIIYRTLKNNWIFEDFTQYKLAPATL